MEIETDHQTPCASQAEADEALLAELGLGPAEVTALKRQGFVRGERSQSGRIVYKLRFRAAGGGVRVIYLGSDAERARRVEEALGRWQEARRAELDLARLGREIARELRDSKRRLAPFLTEHGLHFHGRAIRTKALPNVARNHKHEQG